MGYIDGDVVNGIFVAAKRTGDGLSAKTAYRPWFDGNVFGWSGSDVGDYFACNVFDPQQGKLDSIGGDPRTAFWFPIDVDGTALDYTDIFEIPPQMRGKIIAWCAQTFGPEFGDWVASNAGNRRFVAQEIMRRGCGVPDADPLNGFRIHWTE